MHLPKNFRGFTLIELLVAISIVAIISTVGMVAYTESQKSARDTKRIEDLKNYETALQIFYNANNNYPESDSKSGATSVENLESRADFKTYFKGNSIPKDPVNSVDTGLRYLYYACHNNGLPNKYIMCAKLENCGSKCNLVDLPADGCASVNFTSTNTKYYCIIN